MGSKGSQRTEQTSTATSAPNAQAGALYGDILTRLGNYADQNPNAPVYQGERVAQFTPDQLAAMGTVNQAQGAYQPYMQQAGQFAQQAGSAITPDQINAAMNPYQQQVIDATMAQMGEKNAQQMSALKGTEAQQGAFGGSRAAVTEANLGGQQNMNMASTLAGLNNQNYNQAVAQAQANRSAAGTGAQLQSGLGTQSMQLPFMGAQQQAQQGALQQRLAQQNLDVPYQNFLQQQAYTPQMLQFMASLGTGVGSQMGGTTTNTGQTTNTPAQSSNLGSMLGAGLALASIPLTGGASAAYALPAATGAFASMRSAGGRINKADGGSVGSDIVGNAVRMARQMREGMAGGGVPGAGVGTSEYMGHNIPAIFPTSQMAMGKGAPSTPGFVSSPEMKNPNSDMKGLGAGLGALAKAGYDKWNQPMDISTPAQGAYTPMAVGDISSGTIGGTGLSGFGGVYSLGGTVSPESAYHGFAHRAYGGSLFDPTPISEQGGEDPNKAPVMLPEGFTDQPPSIVPADEFKPYEAPPQADSAPVPMPRPRPESLRVNDLAAAEPMPIGADAVPMPRARPVQTAAAPTGGIFPRIIQTESNGRQLDENGNPLMSPKGATGIAQIMPKTGPEAAKLARLPWDEQKFKYDAKYNAALGKAYFDHQTKVFGGDLEKGAAAYNAGPGRLREAMAMAAANGGSYKDYLPAETQNYLGKIFGQPQAGLGEPANGGPLAFSGDVRQDILAKYAKTPIEVRGEPEQGGLALPFAQGDGGDRTIETMAGEAVKGANTPTQLAQNASILERLTGIQLSDAGRQALMAAGLRMMTTPGNIGTVLGTAGMQGMTTYSEAKQLEQAQIEAQRKQAFEREKFEFEQDKADRPFREMTAQQQAAQIQAERKEAFEREKFERSYRELTAEQRAKHDEGRYSIIPGLTTAEGIPVERDTRHPNSPLINAVTRRPLTENEMNSLQTGGWKPFGDNVTVDGNNRVLINQQGNLKNAQTGQLLPAGTPLKTAREVVLSGTDVGTRGYQLALGDVKGSYSGLPFGSGGNQAKAMVREQAIKILMVDGGLSEKEAAEYLSNSSQAFAANGVGLGAEARTAGVREANLKIILKAAEGAIPSALEGSENLKRTNYRFLNNMIQKGQVAISDPELKEFGMANVQLAEHWARAMNPTGVMRESDRDLALSFLSTSDSKETYKRAVLQLKKQIDRELVAVSSVKTHGGYGAKLPLDSSTAGEARKELGAPPAAGQGAATPPQPAAPPAAGQGADAPPAEGQGAAILNEPPTGTVGTKTDIKSGNLYYVDKDGKSLGLKYKNQVE